MMQGKVPRLVGARGLGVSPKLPKSSPFSHWEKGSGG
jgi:hypothetical protein